MDGLPTISFRLTTSALLLVERADELLLRLLFPYLPISAWF